MQARRRKREERSTDGGKRPLRGAMGWLVRPDCAEGRREGKKSLRPHRATYLQKRRIAGLFRNASRGCGSGTRSIHGVTPQESLPPGGRRLERPSYGHANEKSKEKGAPVSL